MELYKINEVNQVRFYQLPKELFSNHKYRTSLNSDAKLLYALLLDRMELSKLNKWVNENNEIYLLYGQEQLSDMLGVSKPTLIKAFKQLIKHELIYVVRQGLTKPNIIYIGKLLPETLEPQRSKNSLLQEVKNIYSNDTDINKTEKNDNDAVSKRNHITPILNPSTVEYFIKYYLQTYKLYTNTDHANLKPQQWERIKRELDDFIEISPVDNGDIENMVDYHFQRNIDSDYNINHFATFGILENLMYNTAY